MLSPCMICQSCLRSVVDLPAAWKCSCRMAGSPSFQMVTYKPTSTLRQVTAHGRLCSY